LSFLQNEYREGRKEGRENGLDVKKEKNADDPEKSSIHITSEGKRKNP